MNMLPPWLVALITAIVFSTACALPVKAQNVKTYVHPRAVVLLPVIEKEVKLYFPEAPLMEYFPGLIEHESCISLTHSKCWNPESRLKTQREEGLGLGQLTRAWSADGSLRFDSLTAMKKQYPVGLGELDWTTLSKRPDLQIRTMVVMSRDSYRRYKDVPNTTERMKMADSAYNGGDRDVAKSRSVCELTKGCNPYIWTSNVENHCVKSRRILYANRSACDINIHHVKDVFETRSPKYKPYFK